MIYSKRERALVKAKHFLSLVFCFWGRSGSMGNSTSGSSAHTQATNHVFCLWWKSTKWHGENLNSSL